MAARLLGIVLGLPPHEHKEITIDPKIFEGYVGNYELGDFKMAVASEGGRLLAVIRGAKTPLIPGSVRDYVLKGTEVQVIFVPDASGRVKELLLREGGTNAYLNGAN